MLITNKAYKAAYDFFVAGEQSTPAYRRILEQLPKGSSVLDVGSADGLALYGARRTIARHEHQLTCLDMEPLAVQALERRFSGLPAVRAQVGDFWSWQPPESRKQRYDAVLFVTTLVCFGRANLQKAILRALELGGQVWVAQALHTKKTPMRELRSRWSGEVFMSTECLSDESDLIPARGVEVRRLKYEPRTRILRGVLNNFYIWQIEKSSSIDAPSRRLRDHGGIEERR